MCCKIRIYYRDQRQIVEQRNTRYSENYNSFLIHTISTKSNSLQIINCIRHFF